MVVVAEPSSRTETELTVRRALSGDGDAFGAIYDQHVQDVHRVLLGLRLGLSREEVEDAVQETFLRALRDLPRFDATRALRPWVLAIARHVAVDRCRRAQVRAAEPIEPGALVDGSPGSASSVETAARTERAGLVAAAMGALDPEHRAALALRHVDGLSMEDLAVALGCSVPTARARLRGAAHLLAGELRRRGLSSQEAKS